MKFQIGDLVEIKNELGFSGDIGRITKIDENRHSYLYLVEFIYSPTFLVRSSIFKKRNLKRVENIPDKVFARLI